MEKMVLLNFLTIKSGSQFTKDSDPLHYWTTLIQLMKWLFNLMILKPPFFLSGCFSEPVVSRADLLHSEPRRMADHILWWLGCCVNCFLDISRSSDKMTKLRFLNSQPDRFFQPNEPSSDFVIILSNTYSHTVMQQPADYMKPVCDACSN